jgi:uncharacterized protein DUF5591
MKPQPFPFCALRHDWYVGNSVLPRALRRCVTGEKPVIFVDFPRQWLPVFEWYGVKWKGTIPPAKHTPIFSDLEEPAVCDLVERAREARTLRSLVEAASMLDPVLSDCLYILDNTLPLTERSVEKDMDYAHETNRKHLLLNGWQSYGRPSIRALEEQLRRVQAPLPRAVVLPCSLRRPYDQSRTHRKIYRTLEEKGYDLKEFHRVVITSLGVLPEEMWHLPQVLAYDAGVPDIYRILRMARVWFERARYRLVLDCLQFQPYRDVLRILHRESLIPKLKRLVIPGHRHFYVRTQVNLNPASKRSVA